MPADWLIASIQKMSSSNAVIKFFLEETTKKNRKKSAVNIYTVQRLLEEGHELAMFESNRKKGICKVNPLKELYEKGKITSDEYDAGIKYCINYQNSNIDHHSRPSWNGTPPSNNSSQSFEERYTQKQYEASKFVAECKNLIMIKNFRIDGRSTKGKIICCKYDQILKKVFEKEQVLDRVEKSLKISHATAIERIKEICQILMTKKN